MPSFQINDVRSASRACYVQREPNDVCVQPPLAASPGRVCSVMALSQRQAVPSLLKNVRMDGGSGALRARLQRDLIA